MHGKFSANQNLRFTIGVLLLAMICILQGCGGSSSNSLSGITVTPADGSAFVGAALQLKATGTYRDGSTQGLTSSATWTSSITGVATITSPGGLATGVSPGTTEITAASGAVSSGPVELTVMIAPTLTSIAVAPPNASLEVGATLQFSAIGTYDDGSTQIITSQVMWSSSAATVATIASGGLATGAAPGTTTIEASLSGLSGTAILTVDAE
jgi:uncharacterized protein YjdB